MNMGKNVKLSIVLAVFNEEENIGVGLKSIKDLADEIIVVDGGSTDKTVEIAKKFGAKIKITNNPAIFHINKQKAIDLASGDWILQLDADERVTPELKEEISKIVNMVPSELELRKIDKEKQKLFKRHQKILEQRDGKIGKDTGEIVAFFTPRKNYFLGKFLIYGGVYPDGVIRLFKKGKAWFPCKSVHEQIVIDGKVGWLENDLLHYPYRDFSEYLRKSNHYTTLQAIEYKEKKLGTDWWMKIKYLKILPCLRFLELFIRHKGFLDGFPGLVFSFYSGLHIKTSYIKYWEMIKLHEGPTLKK